MQRFALAAQRRVETGKGVARKLRAEGRIPAILYGENQDPVPLTLGRRDVSLFLQGHEGHHFLVDLSVEGDQTGQTLTVLQDLQVDPVDRTLLHVDFRRVDPDKPIRTTIPIHVRGLAIGVREGGIHQQLLRELEVEALPAEMPEYVEIDVSALKIGDSLHVRDIHLEGAKVDVLTDGDRAISTIGAPKLTVEAVEVAEAAAEGEEGVEPTEEPEEGPGKSE